MVKNTIHVLSIHTQSPKAAGIISRRKGGPRPTEIQGRHDLGVGGCSRGILIINFYTRQASGPYQQDLTQD